MDKAPDWALKVWRDAFEACMSSTLPDEEQQAARVIAARCQPLPPPPDQHGSDHDEGQRG